MNRLLRLVFLFFWISSGGLYAQVPIPGRPLPGGTPPVGTQPGTPPGGVPATERSDGRILDDSTKQIYGPTTSRYFLEPDVFNNRKYLYAIDTNYVGFHQYLYTNRLGNRYVDLGNLGTALRPVYYEAPTQIGAQLGYDAFTPYGIDRQVMKYYDTKSPFSHVYYAQGGRGQTIFDFDFSRNVNERLNFGLTVHRISGNKQYGFSNTVRGVNREERLVDHWSFVLHTNYRSKNDKYTLLAHFNQAEHKGSEQGGTDTTGTTVGGQPARLELRQRGAWLNRATFRDRRNQWHVYQQYEWAKGLHLYHVGDFVTRFNRFTDADLATSLATPVYPPHSQRLDSLQLTWLQASARYGILDNKVGLKGTFRNFNYRLHARRRDFVVDQLGQQLLTDSLPMPVPFRATLTRLGEQVRRRANENFLGLWLGYYFPDSTRLTAEGEYLLGRDYRLHGAYQGRWLQARLTSASYSPTLIQEGFYSPLLRWATNFRNTFVNQVEATVPLKLGRLTLEPSFQYSLLRNYVYFDQQAVARQTAVPLSVIRAGLGLGYQRGRWVLGGQAYLARTAGADVFRVPGLLANGRMGYDFVYAKVLYVQMGVELHYKSGYYADAYQPLTQQFYLNDEVRVPGYLVADAFLDLRINRVRLFFKVAHFNDGLMNTEYLLTPGYPGMPRAIGLGVSWLLFD